MMVLQGPPAQLELQEQPALLAQLVLQVLLEQLEKLVPLAQQAL
jgi:hypothetical protein